MVNVQFGKITSKPPETEWFAWIVLEKLGVVLLGRIILLLCKSGSGL